MGGVSEDGEMEAVGVVGADVEAAAAAADKSVL